MPSVRIDDSNYTTTVGDRVILKCSVSALPCVTSVSWEHRSSDQPIRQLDTGDPKYEGSNENYPSLVINDVRKEDEGSYTCTVSRCMGRERASTMLTVNGGIPSVKIQETGYSGVIGERIKLKCSVSAAPTISSVCWQRTSPDGQTVTLDIDGRKYSGSRVDDPHLVIHKLSKDDEGEYLCKVSNSCGESTSVPTKLTVIGGPPVLNMNPKTLYQLEGDVAVLKCNVIATPRLSSIKWMKEGSQIVLDNDKYIGGSLDSPTLIITNLVKEHDEGQYTCMAENCAGKHKNAVDLRVKRKRARIENIERVQYGPISDGVILERIIFRHGQMVNKLSDCIYPEEKETWLKFLQLLAAYAPPRQRSKPFQTIVDFLIQQNHIQYGQYDKLYKIVYDVHRWSSQFIKDAEKDIQIIKERGVPNEDFVKVTCIFVGEYKSEEQVQRFVSQVEEVFPELKGRVEVVGCPGSINLTFTISEAKTPHEPSSLYLAEMFQSKLQTGAIALKDESGEPLKLKNSPTVNITKTDKPNVRQIKGHYRHEEGENAVLKCVVVSTVKIDYIKWFRVKDKETSEIKIDNEKYVGEMTSSCLIISDLKKADSGLYFCRAGNSAKEAESDATFVEIQDPDPQVAGIRDDTKMLIQEELKKGFVMTKSFQAAQQKLLENGIVVIKGNPGDGKTATAIQLSNWLRKERQGRQPLLIRSIEDLDMTVPVSQCITMIDDIFGEKDMREKDVCEWEKRVESVLPTSCGDGNFLIITISNEVFNALDKESSGTVFIKSNIIDLSSNEYKIESERMALLEFYEPKDESFSWTEEEKKEVVKSGIDIGFPLCCRLFRDNPTFQGERGKFFERPFPFLNEMLSKISSFTAIVYLFLCGGEIRKNDLDPKGKKVNKLFLEESFEIDCMGVDKDRPILTNKEKKELVQKSLDSLLDFLVVKEKDQSGDDVYRFLHGSMHDAVAMFYGNRTPNSYIKNCPRKSLLHLTTSQNSPNMVNISPDHYTDVYKRLRRETESETYHDDTLIDSLEVWTDSHFLAGFIKWLYKSTDLPGIEILNLMCSSGFGNCALYLLSEGVKPNKDTPFLVVKGGNVGLLHRILEYDVTLTARADRSQSSHVAANINILHETCLLEREQMVGILCDTYPQLVLETDSSKHSTLHLAALTGNIGIFQAVERTLFTSLGKVEDEQHLCERVDGRVVHRNCVFAQYMDELVNDDGKTVFHMSAMAGHITISKYICQSYPALLTAVEKDGSTVLHVSCRYGNGEICRYLIESYPDLLTAVDKEGRTVLHVSCRFGHMDICLYLCKTHPTLTTFVDERGNHLLHYIARYVSDVNMFKECEAYTKHYAKSTGRKYDITTILDSNEKTVLHKSCKGGNKELSVYLCQSYPALTAAIDKNGSHCLHYTARYMSGIDMFIDCETHVKQYLQSRRRTYDITSILDNRKRTVLHMSCEAGHKNLCIYLCKSYPALTTAKDIDGSHCLHYIASCTPDVDIFTECETCVKRFLKSTGKQYDATSILDKQHRTVLHKSCEAGHKNLCLYLCKSSPALTTVKDLDGSLCLHYIASWTKDVDMFTKCETYVRQYIESSGQKYDITTMRDDQFRTVLHKSCEAGFKDLSMYLCKTYPALTTVKEISGAQCLHYIAGFTSDVDLFIQCETLVKQFLKSSGQQYDIKTFVDRGGLTALHYSCNFGQKKLCAFLCQKYPELISVVDKKGCHCLHCTLDVDTFTECETCIKKSFKSKGRKFDITTIRDNEGRTVLHFNCVLGKIELCLYLCQSYPALVNALDDGWNTVLHWSCLGEHDEFTLYLCKTFPELTLVLNKRDCNCLHYMAERMSDVHLFAECETLVKQYVESKGRRYNITTLTDYKGKTVLHSSCERDNTENSLYLCQTYPALTAVVDKNGFHCLHYLAKHTSDVEMFSECEKHVKQFIESNGGTYAIKSILTKGGKSVLDMANESVSENSDDMIGYLSKRFDKYM